MAMATHATGQGSSSGSSQASQAPHPSGTSSRIDVNNATRAHPLFGMLDYIIRNTQNQTSKLETRISTLEKNVDKIIDIQGELKQLMEEYCDSTFSIEKTSYQAPLRKGAAILFCNSMFRTPTEDSVLKMVKATLRSDIHSKRILHASLKFTNSLFVTFRSEERRRILHPSGKYRNKGTKSLAALIMGYMKANTDSCPNYTRNLALLRKFIRERPSIFTEKKSFYGSFKAWVEEKYGPGGNLTALDWKEVLEEDSATCYMNDTMTSTSTSDEGELGDYEDPALMSTGEEQAGDDLYNYV